MSVINFMINNILTQAAITIALIAMLGLILQKKSTGQVISGTLKCRFECYRHKFNLFWKNI